MERGKWRALEWRRGGRKKILVMPDGRGGDKVVEGMVVEGGGVVKRVSVWCLGGVLRWRERPTYRPVEGMEWNGWNGRWTERQMDRQGHGDVWVGRSSAHVVS